MAETNKTPVAKAAKETPWIGSPKKVFKGTTNSVDLRTVTSEQLAVYRKKYPSCFRNVKS